MAAGAETSAAARISGKEPSHSHSPNALDINVNGEAREGEGELMRASDVEDLLREAYEMRASALQRSLSRLDKSRYCCYIVVCV